MGNSAPPSVPHPVHWQTATCYCLLDHWRRPNAEVIHDRGKVPFKTTPCHHPPFLSLEIVHTHEHKPTYYDSNLASLPRFLLAWPDKLKVITMNRFYFRLYSRSTIVNSTWPSENPVIWDYFPGISINLHSQKRIHCTHHLHQLSPSDEKNKEDKKGVLTKIQHEICQIN